MKLTSVTILTVDGVMQGLGAPDEDRRGGFERGGWVATQFGEEEMGYLGEVYQRAAAFLFGRWTFETFAASWGAMVDPSSHPVGDALDKRPKYVASTTLTEPGWTGSTVLSGDIEAAVTALKAEGDGELQIHGSGRFVRWLQERGLIDEMVLLTVPVVVGQGVRLFPDSGPDVALELVSSQATARGVTIQVYRPSGRPEYATASEHVD